MNTTQKPINKRNDTSASTIKAPESKMSSPKIPRSTSASNNHPSHEDIAARAYQIYLERGGTNGNDQDDWLQAERELTGRK